LDTPGPDACQGNWHAGTFAPVFLGLRCGPLQNRKFVSKKRPNDLDVASRAAVEPLSFVLNRDLRSLCARERYTKLKSALGIWKVFERIEDFQSGPSEILHVPGRDGESVPACRRGDVAVFDRHPATGLFELMLLLCPDMRHRNKVPDTTIIAADGFRNISTTMPSPN